MLRLSAEEMRPVTTLDSPFFRVMLPLYSRLLMMGMPFTVCVPRERMFNSNFKVTSRSA